MRSARRLRTSVPHLFLVLALVLVAAVAVAGVAVASTNHGKASVHQSAKARAAAKKRAARRLARRRHLCHIAKSRAAKVKYCAPLAREARRWKKQPTTTTTTSTTPTTTTTTTTTVPTTTTTTTTSSPTTTTTSTTSTSTTTTATALPTTKITPSLWSGPRDWTYNQLAYRSDMWRWDATTQPVHAHSSDVMSVIKQGAESWIAPQYFAATQTQAWDNPLFVGRSSDPLQSFSDQWTSVTNVHTPSYAKADGTSDGAWEIIDGPTGRSVAPTPWATSVHDLVNGPGYSANSQDQGIPGEVGGPSSGRIEPAGLHIRFPNLYRADVDWHDAIRHPLLSLIPGPGIYPNANSATGMAARGDLAYGYGTRQTADGRLPFVFPAHSGEESTRGSAMQYAPPNGTWLSLDPTVWTDSRISSLSAPNYVKAILWTLREYGTFIVDVSGQKGIQLETFEGVWPYENAGDHYATDWLAGHMDGKYLRSAGTGAYSLDITGGDSTLRSDILNNLRVLQPPAKPGDLSS